MLPEYMPPVRLLSTACAVPPHRVDQDAVTALAQRIYAGRVEAWDHVAPVFASTGVRTRYSAAPLEWFTQAHGWVDKTRRFAEVADTLLEEVGRAALERAGVEPSDVTAVVSVCSTGIATPSLEAALLPRLGLPATTQRLPLFGLGCAGGALGLARAAAMARSQPGRPVLLLVVELCTLAFRHDDLSSASVVATALFGDGAAGAVLLADEVPGTDPVVLGWGEYTWPDTADVMGWTVEEDGLGVVFARRIPALVREHLRPAADAFLAAQGLTEADLDGLIAHPGGPKVLDGIAESFPRLAGSLNDSAAVLADYGNMSAASVLFVLDACRILGRSGRQLLLSFGPGFSAGFVLLEM